MATHCAECDYVHAGSRKEQPWRWMCVKHKRLGGYGFVIGEAWETAPPYLHCKDVNGGACPLFTPARTPEN